MTREEIKRKRLPKSIRKFIRKEKSRIKKEISNPHEREKIIASLYEDLLKYYKKDKLNKKHEN